MIMAKACQIRIPQDKGILDFAGLYVYDKKIIFMGLIRLYNQNCPLSKGSYQFHAYITKHELFSLGHPFATDYNHVIVFFLTLVDNSI